MQSDELIGFSKPRENNLNQVNVIEIQPARIQQDPGQQDFAAIPDAPLFLFPLSLMIAWAIIFFMPSDIWRLARHGMLISKQLHRVPCRNCRFFTNNPYLQCAVHPSTALTASAIHCCDYLPSNGRS